MLQLLHVASHFSSAEIVRSLRFAIEQHKQEGRVWSYIPLTYSLEEGKDFKAGIRNFSPDAILIDDTHSDGGLITLVQSPAGVPSAFASFRSFDKVKAKYKELINPPDFLPYDLSFPRVTFIEIKGNPEVNTKLFY
ncbi:hypothetical protein HYW76_00820, partial [Candidatus Pacearchaeota archaeon]|nr:hypothetical protein [Candidatus Pacearchaeota archaeon]